MEIREMNLEELELKMTELRTALESEDANLDDINAQIDEIEKRRAELKAEADKAIEERTAIANDDTLPIITTFTEERKEMSSVEVRNSQAYIDAFAQYIKTNDATECRALLTENATSGTVAVPDLVEGAIRHAWDNEPVMAEVRKTYLKGNVKIGFEISATGAVEHTEGAAAVTEEELVLGIAKLEPVSIKKWISISDEVLDMNGSEFLEYIYSELGYQIAKKCADEIVADIIATDASGSATVPAQAVISGAPALDTIAKAVANLSDEASNPIIIMNKLTYADFKKVQAEANYGQDVFDGLKVIFNNSLRAYSAATAGSGQYLIVGDLGRGAQANFPNGQDIEFKFDDKVLMTSDLVRVLGRMYCGHAVVAPKCFTKVTKPSV